MGKKSSRNGSQSVTNVPSAIMKKSNGNKQPNINAKSMMKLDHIRKLADWASGEAALPSLNAFFGHRLTALTENLGASQDSSLLQCQRCESILHPGENCTVRIEKNRSRRHKKTNVPSTQNNVVYTCHFCSHQTKKRGTPKGHMKKICPPKPKLLKKPEPLVPTTPLVETRTMTLLESKQRKRNRSGKKKATELDGSSTMVELSTSKKRKKKSWTSLKEIAEKSENDRNNNLKFANLTIPFLL